VFENNLIDPSEKYHKRKPPARLRLAGGFLKLTAET
jgi:hypothetical protein